MNTLLLCVSSFLLSAVVATEILQPPPLPLPLPLPAPAATGHYAAALAAPWTI